MKIIQNASQMSFYANKMRLQKKRIGFVPTMGFLHEGHLSLIRRSVRENDISVLSIFVNPTQFGKNEDYGKYPRNITRDKKLARSCGVDAIFYPRVNEIYPKGYATYVVVEGLSQKLCGVKRPIHFKGVTTIVLKLLNILNPESIYLGRKDIQQAIIIGRMIEDLGCRTKLKTCPIVREKDGLAMSSRNSYLNSSERKRAAAIYGALKEARFKIKRGVKQSRAITDSIRRSLKKSNIKTEYVSVADMITLDSVSQIRNNTFLAIACQIGRTRLIDNLVIYSQKRIAL